MRHAPLLVLIACGGKGSDDTGSVLDSGGEINTPEPVEPVVPDCAWFTGDNCWKSAVRAVDACLPTDRDAGAFAPDFQTCSFGDDGRLNLSSTDTFSTPFEWSSLDVRGFQLTDQTGSTCVSYLAESGTDSTSWVVTTSEGEVRYEVPDLLSVGGLLTCPDGAIYDLGEDIMSCPDANTYWPFMSHAATGSSLTFGMQGGDETLSLFTCAG